MNNKVVYGVRISLNEDYGVNAEWGLGVYGQTKKSEFRWVEQPIRISGDKYNVEAPTWKDGILMSVDPITQSLSCKSGGGQAQWSGTTVTINGLKGLITLFEKNGILLQGRTCEIYEFCGDIEANVGNNWSQTLIFTGICGNITWDERTITINVKANERGTRCLTDVINNGSYSSMSELITDINDPAKRGIYSYADSKMNGKLVPMTFGKLDKAKMVQTENVCIPLSINGEKITDTVYVTNFYAANGTVEYRFKQTIKPVYGSLNTFPVVGDDEKNTNNCVLYKIKISDVNCNWYSATSALTTGIHELNGLSGKYLTVISGQGAGQSRRICHAYFCLTNNTQYTTTGGTKITLSANSSVLIVEIEKSNYFVTSSSDDTTPKKLISQSTSTKTETDNASWVQIQDVHKAYTVDVWPCASFLNSSSSVITTDSPVLSVYCDEKKNATDNNHGFRHCRHSGSDSY